MKRNIIIALILAVALGIEAYQWHTIVSISSDKTLSKTLRQSTQAIDNQYTQLLGDNQKLKKQEEESQKAIKMLQDEITAMKTRIDILEQNEVELLISKLKDKTYISTYNEGYTWYTAAEALGTVGKSAIPGLIKKIDTKDSYERSLVFYALMLASQADNVKEFADSDYIHISDAFDVKKHDQAKQEVLRWWEKYKDKFLT